LPRPVQLSIELLETFLTLLRHDGDAGQAARVLGINQPSMSKRLAFLQYAGPVLKRPWVRRQRKTWLLTEEGRRVLPVVHELLDRYRNLAGFTNAARPAPRSELRFACGQTAGALLVRRALTEFRKHHPDAQIRISSMRAPQRISGVASGAIDMALVNRSEEEIKELARGVPLKIEEIGRFGYSLVCGNQSPWESRFDRLPRQTPLPLSTLADFPLIVPEPDSHTRKILDPILRRQSWGEKVEFRLEIGGWLTILDYVRAGHGVGLVSDLAIDSSAPRSPHIRALATRQLPPLVLKIVTREDGDSSTISKSVGQSWRECVKGSMGK
jgi:DNA-binding transcriptional LysR family regulator